MGKKALLIGSIGLNVVLLLVASLFVYEKGGVSYILEKISPSVGSDSGFSEYYYGKESTFGSIEAGSEDPVIFLGDSLTDYGEWNEYFEQDNVLNRGIAGDSTAGVLNRIDQVTDAHPSQVFLMVGINDLRRGIEAETILSNYQSTLEEITADSPDTEIYIQSILPMNKNLHEEPVDSDSVSQLNEELVKLSEQAGATFINLWDVMSDKDDLLSEELTYDGVHLNGLGYAKWVEVVRGYID